VKLSFTIYGEAASSKNSREVVTIGARKRQVIVGEGAIHEYTLERREVVVKEYPDGRIDCEHMLVLVGAPAFADLKLETHKVGGRTMLIKGDKAQWYEQEAFKQIPRGYRLRLEGRLKVTLRMFYASERPDMDEQLILDILQDRYERSKVTKERKLVQAGVYRNDRQIRERHVHHAIDKANPRTEIEVETMEVAGQEALELEPPLEVMDEVPF